MWAGHPGRSAARWLFVGCTMLLAGCGDAGFDAWAQNICAQNDAIDQDMATTLPRKDILLDINYPEKLRALIDRKQALKAAVDEYQAPITRNALRNKLSVALNNSLRYLRALESQYQIAKEHYEEIGGDETLAGETGLSDMQSTMRDLTVSRAAYQVDPREVMMKRQYEKLYTEVRAELGLPTHGF